MGADGQGLGAPHRRGQVIRRAILRTAALGAVALALYILYSLPRRTVHLPSAAAASTLTGAFHVHSNRSDGSGDVGEIASAAAAAGLQFVVLTDHGDATRAPDPPAYRDGVLLIDAVEISTVRGHVIGLGLANAAPFPLAGEPEDVVEDIHRLRGRAIVAHPDSPKPALRWTGADAYDGLEIINADSEWRDESFWRLAATGLRALWRPTEAVVSLFDRPSASLARWDAALRRRPLVGIAGVDAHARIGADHDGGAWEWAALRLPSYRQMFRALAQVVLLDAPPTGDATRDAAALLTALVRGRSFAAVRGIADPARVTFTAEQSGRLAAMGDTIARDASTIFSIAVSHAPGALVTLIADGNILAFGRGTLVAQRRATASSYRVEVYVPGTRVPWIVTNPIFVSATSSAAVPPHAPAEWRERDLAAAHVEHDASSKAALTQSGGAADLAFELGTGAPAGQFSAIAVELPGGESFDRIRFTARATQPMRVSIQLRLPRDRDGVRWRRSVYVDGASHTFDVPLSAFRAVDHTTALGPVLGQIDAILFVVDTLNTMPGTRGTVTISAVATGR